MNKKDREIHLFIVAIPEKLKIKNFLLEAKGIEATAAIEKKIDFTSWTCIVNILCVQPRRENACIGVVACVLLWLEPKWDDGMGQLYKYHK